MSGYDLFVGKVSLIYPHANYEWRYEDSTLRQFHYLENGILVLKENNNDFWYFRILTDNVGSVVRVIDSEGTAVVEVSYDAWGKPTVALNQMAFPRGFGGHEMLTKYRLVNMDGRLYDYELGRFLSPDDYVQEPSNSQNFNRYTYCLNNPLKYTDPTGEVWWTPILVGAIIGGALSGTSYAVSTLVTGGKWNARDFLKSMGMGAFSGALAAGVGQVAASFSFSQVFTNIIGYKILSQATNTVITNAVFGNSMDWSDVAGIAVSSLFAAALPDYKAKNGSAFSNFMGETVHNTTIGATSGFVHGATKALIKKNPDYVYQYALGGAISGFSRTIGLNVLMGAPFEPDPILKVSSKGGVIRKGGISQYVLRFLGRIDNGITLGRKMLIVIMEIPRRCPMNFIMLQT